MARKSKRMIAAEQAVPLSGNIYNVAIYVRLSIEDKYYKNGTDSLATQEEMALEYLKDKADMKLYKVYSDNGETGSNFERQGFQDMMYDVYNGKVNCIIVKDLSRFGREYIEMGDWEYHKLICTKCMRIRRNIMQKPLLSYIRKTMIIYQKTSSASTQVMVLL